MAVKNVLPTQLVASQAKYAKPIYIGHMGCVLSAFVSHTESFSSTHVVKYFPKLITFLHRAVSFQICKTHSYWSHVYSRSLFWGPHRVLWKSLSRLCYTLTDGQTSPGIRSFYTHYLHTRLLIFYICLTHCFLLFLLQRCLNRFYQSRSKGFDEMINTVSFMASSTALVCFSPVYEARFIQSSFSER